MTARGDACPDDERLEIVLEGAASAAEERAVREHAAHCESCRDRLEAASRDDALLDVARPALEELDASHVRTPLEGDAEQRSLAGYRILERIGEGGMGVVFAAEQETPRRVVALKIMQPGFGSEQMLHRFQHETELLGRLEHDGIARIYEAGTFGSGAERRPFFAMERIDGRPLDVWVAEEGPTRDDRLRLFKELCEAVAHAHQKGVIHRDLKPANILVTAEGRPKIVDFGVARATDLEATLMTRPGQVLGTLPYMSPEQVGGDPDAADVRSDVYSLGVLLYELLAGKRPLDLANTGLADAARKIQEQVPPSLATLDPSLRGDLEIIARCALEKDPDRRYPSALALGTDVARFLDHQPILARPPSALYQFGRFARRHRAVVGGAVLVVLVLIAGITTTTTQWLRARSAEQDALESEQSARTSATSAREEARKARAITDFLMKSLVQASPDQQAVKDPTIRDVFEYAASRVSEDFAGEPLVQAEMFHTIGFTYLRLGQLHPARTHLDRALALYRGHLGEDSIEVARCWSCLGQVELKSGRPELAEPLLEKALAIRRRSDRTEARLLAANIESLCMARFGLEKTETIEPLMREALAVTERELGEDDVATATTRANLISYLMRSGGDPDEITALLAPTIDVLRRHYNTRDFLVAALSHLARLELDAGRLEPCANAVEEAIAVQGEGTGSPHGMVLDIAQELDDALVAALDGIEGEDLDADQRRMRLHLLRAALQFDLDRNTSAERSADRAARLLDRLTPPHPIPTETDPLTRPLLRLSRSMARAGYWERAEELISSRIHRIRHARDPLGTAILEHALGDVLIEGELYDDAELRLLNSLDTFREQDGETAPRTRAALESLVRLYAALGDEAEEDRYRALLRLAPPSDDDS